MGGGFCPGGNRFSSRCSGSYQCDSPVACTTPGRQHSGGRKPVERCNCAGGLTVCSRSVDDREILIGPGIVTFHLGRGRRNWTWLARWRGDSVGAATSRRSTRANHHFIANAVSRVFAGGTLARFGRSGRGFRWNLYWLVLSVDCDCALSFGGVRLLGNRSVPAKRFCFHSYWFAIA